MKKKYYPSAESARLATAVALSAGMLAACGGSDSPAVPAAVITPPVVIVPTPVTNTLPTGVTQLSLVVYPATAPGTGDTAATQDLLTGGLGRSGLGSPSPTPAYANPLAPTALELRRNTIRSNYQTVLDTTVAGGFGTLYGPNVNAAGVVTANEGMIAGREYQASLDDGTGRKRVTMAVQIPDTFNQTAACVVLAPSSGSRGVYGAIGVTSEWALKNGCAVALTDAGKGIGFYDMNDDTVNRIDGTRATRADAGLLSFFAANITDTARAAYNLLFPNRVAIKQVHSQLNPEKDWGSDTLVAARYALYALNDRYGTTAAPVPFSAANTIIIGASVSNGGAAVLKAAEQDTSGLIDGVVAGEPNAQPSTTTGYGIQFAGAPVAGYGKTMADYTTYGNLYQPCAALAAPAVMSETSVHNYMSLVGMGPRATARCDGLAAKGLVTGATTAAQSLDALNKLRAYGWTPDNDIMHNAHFGLGNGPILSAMYPVSYGRFSVTDNVCNTSFAYADATGTPVAASATSKAQSFPLANGASNGGAAGATPGVIYNDSVGGSKLWTVATSSSTGVQDFGLDNAMCQRALVTGVDTVTGAALSLATTPTKAQSDAVRAGIAEVLFTGNLQAKPTIIVAGRSDALLPINNNARAYVAYNRSVEGSASKARYIEVTNAQHFDGFLGLSGFDTRYIPLHTYFVRALDAMYSNLKNGTALPPSQVVRTTARGGAPGAAPAITGANVPAISAAPLAGDQIGFAGTSLAVPN